MSNMIKVEAHNSINLTQAIGAAFDGEALASLAEIAGYPERAVNKIRLNATRDKLQNRQGL
jgi:hypothetical protein